MIGSFVFVLFLSLVSVVAGFSSENLNEKQGGDSHFYLRFGSGASFSTKSKIKAPANTWDLAVQGYSSRLGTKAIVDAGFGYEFCPLIAADIMASYRPNFTYAKKQTAIYTDVPGFLGDKVRRFNLDVGSLMGSIYLNGFGINALKWNVNVLKGCIYPFIGSGVGISRMKLFDFRSTGIIHPELLMPTFASANQYKIDYRFTYQAMAGFEYRCANRFALTLGYRWFHVNKFSGPRYVRNEDGVGEDVGANTWSIPFSANEIFLDLKVIF